MNVQFKGTQCGYKVVLGCFTQVRNIVCVFLRWHNIILASIQYTYIPPLQEGAMKVANTMPVASLGNVPMVATHGVFMQCVHM